MEFLKKLLCDPRRLFLVPLLAGVGLVGAGLVLAKLMNLAACPLCILQRMLYLLAAAVGLLGLATPRGGRILAALLLTATTATGAFVAGYQVWLQRFATDTNCAADQPWWERFVDWAGMQVPWLFEGTGMCNDRSWTFLTLSIADWSLLIFSGLTVFALYALSRQRT